MMTNASLINALNINNITIFICCAYIIFVFWDMKRRGLKSTTICLLPSIVIPFLILLGYCSPLVWLAFDPLFKINFLKIDNLNEAVLIVLIASLLIIIGIIQGRGKIFKKIYYRKTDRNLDCIFYDSLGKKVIIFLILASIFIFPFCFGFRIDLILHGGIRNLKINNEILFRLIPFARILLSIFTIFSGVIYSYKKEKLIFIIPFLDTLQHLMKLSRGFFLPLILFFFASSLSGTKFPKWTYYLMPILGILAGSAAINARGLSTLGISGIFTGVSHVNTNLIESIRKFFEVNSVIGILSTTITLRDPSHSFLDGLISWIQSILPIPSFFGVTSTPLSFAQLRGIHHAGIPMPALGEIFYQMGWLGLVIFLLLGILLGRIEGEIIKHNFIYGKAYWPHIIIYISLVLGFILSLHSPSRSASRLFIYSAIFILIMKNLFNKKEYINSHERKQKS